LNIDLNQQHKQLVWDFWKSLEMVQAGDIETVAQRYMHKDALWHGPDPIDDLQGLSAFVSGFWLPLRESFPDLKRQTHVFMGGKSSGRVDGTGDGRMWVGGTGYFNGVFENDYLGIPATGEEVSIRWGEFCRVEDQKIVETFLILDIVDLMQQAGFDVLPTSHGVDGVYPPPQANDGVLLEEQNASESDYTLEHIRTFIFDGLNNYDQSELKSMGMADYFHPDVKWYGPGGIGACLSFSEFEDNHQRHWLKAFPDRSVQNLDALIAEGGYSGAPGWAGVTATHTGEYLGCAPTGRKLEINGLDFWKLENDQYVENWVFVDMIHLFRQFGVDLFERMADLRSGARGFRFDTANL
jgi:predicted ester cyclase